ncbi:MAG TPA: DUF1559 domain-containing protein, partial [Pirellulales bacterium]|nr:DUF1559 domain-containing protein [Pirellulales bacterium]
MEQCESHQPPQFSLKRLFAITAALGIALGTMRAIGPLLSVIAGIIGAFAFATYLMPGSKAEKRVRASIAALITTAMFAFVPLLLEQPRTPSRRSQCNNSLKQVALGLLIYADVYGSLPPAYIADKNGRPLHSWRILILPYLECRDLYARYDFNEPWDGPHNRLLADFMPYCYHCVSDGPWPSVTTSFLAVTGPETPWSGTTSSSFSDIVDGTSNTIAVVEVAGSGINWLEPRDLPFAALKNG